MNAAISNRFESLNKENYDTWKMQMQAVLVKNNAWKYANGKCEKPELVPGNERSIAERTKWDEEDEKAKSDIILSIHPSELKQIKACHTSREVWLKLEGIYQSKEPARKATLLKRLALQKMADGDDVREHMRTFFDAVDKLQEMQVIINPDLLAILLLYSLPSRYENFRCAIESRDNLPEPEALRVKIIEESDARSNDIVQNAMIAGKRAYKYQRPKSDMNSKIETEREKPKIKCYNCGKIGHKAFECRSNKGQKQTAKRIDATSFYGFSREESGNDAPEDNRRSTKKSEDACLFSATKRGMRKHSRASVGSCHGSRARGAGARDARALTSVKSDAFEAMRAKNIKHMNVWCLDSGCTSHMCKDASDFVDVGSRDIGRLNLASSASTEIRARGTVCIAAISNGRETNVTLPDTLHVPDLRTNLLSVGKITERGYNVIFKRNSALITDGNGNTTLAANRINGLYYVQQKNVPDCHNVSESDTEAVQSNTTRDIDKWHRRLGHLNISDLLRCAQKGTIRGLNFGRITGKFQCEICAKCKMTRSPFPMKSERVTELLELIHSDVCGPMRVESNGRAKYFVTFIDDYSKWCEVRTISKKSDVFKCFVDFRAYAETATGRKLKCIQTDNGAEYMSTEFSDFLRTNGIQRRLTVTHTPEQNGVAERRNRTLMDTARCLLMQSSLPISFWGEAVNTANYIRNRCPSRSLDGKTAFEKWTGKIPDVSHLREFGCETFTLNRDPNKSKFAPRSTKGILVGYSEQSKAYRIWLPEERRVDIARDVKFVTTSTSSSANDYIEFAADETNQLPIREVTFPTDTYLDHDAAANDRDHTEDVDLTGEGSPEEENLYEEVFEEGDLEGMNDALPRRGWGRPRKIRTGFRGRPRKEYCIANCTDEPEESMYLAEIPIELAIRGPDSEDWYRAIAEETKSILKNDTWTIVDKPKNQKVIGSRIVLRNKYLQDGTLDRRKARIVARGFSQRPGIEFNETFAPVAGMGSVRTMMALAAEKEMVVHQFDVTTAYLNGALEEKVFMEIPKYVSEALKIIVQTEQTNSAIGRKAAKMLDDLETGDKVCLLRKALYGLRQAGRCWNEKISSILLEFGMKASPAEPCVFYKGSGAELLLVAIYVDDILVAARNQFCVSDLKRHLSERVELKDLGAVNYCLGIEFTQDRNKITMCQEGYIRDLLHRFGMTESKAVATPMDPAAKLSGEEVEASFACEKLPYRELVGSLMYLAVCIRPDIAFAVSCLSQFNDRYDSRHWTAAKRVLRYLKGTPRIGLTFRKTNTPLEGFVDADWANCPENRRSYSGFVFLLGGCPISWEARKQRTVALSSTEAEYMALAEAAKEATYLHHFIADLGFRNLSGVRVFCDNNGARRLAENCVFHNRSKHIDTRHHYVREVVKSGLLSIEYTPTQDMAADLLTKSIAGAKHRRCLEILGVRSVTARDR